VYASKLRVGKLAYLGADPELFITRGGKIVPSEEVVPTVEEWMKTHYGLRPLIVRDGVQVELHTCPHSCRQVFVEHLRARFNDLSNLLRKATHLGSEPLTIDWSPVIEIPREQFDVLSPECKRLGCMPSRNAYGDHGIDVEGETYRWRSAGGHMHFGFDGVCYDDVTDATAQTFKGWQELDIPSLVVLLDILVGNMSVLLERDPLQAIRRRTYGIAGEYRTPQYGVEYRVPSNFWLRHPILLHLMFGVARQAIVLWYNKRERDLISLVDIAKVRKAINESDADLALENFLPLRKFLREEFEKGDGDYAYPLAGSRIDFFEHFITKPLEEWFGTEHRDNWQHRDGLTSFPGWEVFADSGGTKK
jgi:hypothetical protein